jgi:hypothetical protein
MPYMIAAIKRLEGIWPRAEPFDALLQHVITTVAGAVETDTHPVLTEALVLLITNELVECRTHDLPLSEGLSDRPIASPLARLQADEGTRCTTLLHKDIEIEDQRTRHLLTLLDGNRDRRALAGWLRTSLAESSADASMQHLNNYLKNFTGWAC